MALDLDESEENVQITITYLLNSGLLEMRSDDEYYLPDTKNSTGCETAVAARVRRHREKQKALQCNTDVTEVKHLCNGEIEKEKELDKEKDIEIEHRDRDISISTTRENKEIENFQSLTPMSNIDIYDFWTNSFGVISSFVKGSLDDLIAEYGLVNVADALRIAKERGKSRVQYVEGILKNQRLENGTNGHRGGNRTATRKDEQVDWEQEAAKTYGKD